MEPHRDLQEASGAQMVHESKATTDGVQSILVRPSPSKQIVALADMEQVTLNHDEDPKN